MEVKKIELEIEKGVFFQEGMREEPSRS